jgi:hypothetical protein
MTPHSFRLVPVYIYYGVRHRSASKRLSFDKYDMIICKEISDLIRKRSFNDFDHGGVGRPPSPTGSFNFHLFLWFLEIMILKELT